MICSFWFLAIFPPAILANNMFGMMYTAVHCSDALIYQMNEWCTLQYIALMLWYISDEWMMYTAVHCSDAPIYQADKWMMYTAVHCSDALIYIRWMNDVHCSTLLWCSDISDEGMMYTAVHCSDALIHIRWMNDVHCSTLLWCSDIYQMNEWCTLQYIALMLWYITLLWCSDIYQADELLF